MGRWRNPAHAEVAISLEIQYSTTVCAPVRSIVSHYCGGFDELGQCMTHGCLWHEVRCKRQATRILAPAKPHPTSPSVPDSFIHPLAILHHLWASTLHTSTASHYY
jgi:hypothetical protein